MKKLSAFSILTLLFSVCYSQYKYDNVKYKAVYLEDLCQAIQANPGFLILDVRSKGEYNDSSTYLNYNIGHISNAINIDVRDLPHHLNDLSSYKNKPVFVYCSHSQRSRRASAMLADSGFTKVFNINGGLTSFRINDVNSVCNKLFVRSNLPFTFVSPKQLSHSSLNEYIIIDVRDDSSFRSITNNEIKNSMGKFRNSINIPSSLLSEKLSLIPKTGKVLLVDEDGNESIKAAEFLTQQGFHNLSVLFDGLEMYNSELPETERRGWIKTTPYSLINSYYLSDLVKSNKDAAIIDIRTKEEFFNHSKDSWRNIGNIKNAINIPFSDLKTDPSQLNVAKNAPIILYAFSTQPEIFSAAELLASSGYTNINVLMGGLFNLRWRAANIKGRDYLNQWVVNVPELN
ncbi:MAG: rhodanese-like domain-containing protein [Flavisolibacter sp.]